jgi:methylenetetrahydrofolate dehydrogenase (NADP+)/methenyltetrahydrofolate cyclohydrolase
LSSNQKDGMSMEPEKLYCKELAASISKELADRTSGIKTAPVISCILTGDDPASLSYVRGMQKRAEKVGMQVDLVQLPADITPERFIEELEKQNTSESVCGIIIQVPLPPQVPFSLVAEKINPARDIDGIHPYNIGRLVSKRATIVPATALAVDTCLAYIEKNHAIELSGQRVAIIGRSLTVGAPLIHLLLQRNMTPVTIHTKTRESELVTGQCKFVIAACGVPEMINERWLSTGSVVIDVGIHSIDMPDTEKGYRLCGDVCTESALQIARIVTAVPGGIGTLTSTLLFVNAWKCYTMLHDIEYKPFSFEKQ